MTTLLERPSVAPASPATHLAAKTPLAGAASSDLPHSPVSPAPQYDPEQLTRQYQGRYGQLLRRIIQVIWPFVHLLLWVHWDRWRGVELAHRPQHARRLRDILTELGPAFIKIGQALSTRPDLLSPLFLEEMTKLQDELPPFDNELAYRLIEEELGQPPSQIYREMSESPIAAASLGQVYQGYLHSGQKVAIKVQRPNLVEQISLDMYLVRQGMAWLKKNTRIRSDLVGIVDEFAGKLYEEMDYSQEGRNAEHFARLYQNTSIYTPKIYWQYSGRRVLTMEWIDGVKLTQLDKVKAAGLDGRALVEIGVNCSLKQLLEHGFFHADPHPGNLLAMADGRLAYIDFGMMSTLQVRHRYGLLKAIVHLVNRDFPALTQDYVDLDFLDEETDLSPIIPALSSVFAEAMGASVAEMNFKSITDKLSGVMYDYPFRVPAYYALIIRSLLTLEGIAIGIDPHFKVLAVAYPYVASRILSDPAPELRESLRELLFDQGQFRWTRLENLLRNASHSEDFRLEQSLDKALDFLLSERGEFIRRQLADSLFSLSGSQTSTLDHVQRLWDILAANPAFDPITFLPLMGKVITHPEAIQLTQQLANRWLQRSAARWIRQVFLPPDVA
ncbi:MAG: AarF/ABC1/UbiB kinase family protein [Synechococcales cyanobacterium]